MNRYELEQARHSKINKPSYRNMHGIDGTPEPPEPKSRTKEYPDR